MKIFLRIFIHARNSINHHMLAWVVVAAVMTDMGLGGGACGTTIYADSLVGSGGALNGTPADTAARPLLTSSASSSKLSFTIW